jgi:hypothetical protein
MRRLYILLASAVIATMLIVVAIGASASPSPSPGTKLEYVALAIAPSLIKIPNIGPNSFYPEAEASVSTTLGDAKKRALASCESNGISRERYYKDDCQGAVWVHKGWLALATERLAPEGTKVPYRYKYAYGGAYGPTRNKAIGKAVDNCYSKDPQYEECVFVDATATDSVDPNKAPQGGSW